MSIHILYKFLLGTRSFHRLPELSEYGSFRSFVGGGSVTKVWLIVSALCLLTGIGVRGIVMPASTSEGDIAPVPAATAHQALTDTERVEMNPEHGPALGLFRYEGTSLVNYQRWSPDTGPSSAEEPQSADQP